MNDNKRRVNLMMDESTAQMLDELAEGERKRGQYLDQLIRREYATKRAAPDIRSMDIDALRLMIQGLAGRVQSLEGELVRMQSQVATLIAERA